MSIKEELCKKFDDKDIKIRIMRSGFNNKGFWAKGCRYVDSTAIQNRFDEVFGWENWEPTYQLTNYIDNKGRNKSGFLCTIHVHMEDKTICKQNGADLTDVEDFKGGISDSFKRCASSGFGIGRYLYQEDEFYLECSSSKDSYYTEYAKTKDEKIFYWHIPDTDVERKGLPISPLMPKTPKNKISDKQPKDYKITANQHKIMLAMMNKTLLTLEDLKVVIKDKYNLDSSKDLLKSQYDYICDYIETRITKVESESLIGSLYNKGLTDEDLNKVLNKSGCKKLCFLDKKGHQMIKGRLEKVENKYVDLPMPTDINRFAHEYEKETQEAKALFGNGRN